MKHLIFAFALALASTADAQSSVSCSSSERFGTVLVRVGDSERRVIEAKPNRTVQLETREGGAAGYRHDFYKYGRTVQVYVQAGIVVHVCRVREL